MRGAYFDPFAILDSLDAYSPFDFMDDAEAESIELQEQRYESESE